VPSHMGSIGFSTPDMDAFIVRAATEGRRVPVPDGTYVHWAMNGAELWTQLDKSNSLVGCNPHFAGKGRMRVEITELIQDPNDALDGSAHCWLEDPSGAQISPCLIDVPDFQALKGWVAVPSSIELQVTAFAHELRCYETDVDFEAHQLAVLGEEPPDLAAESFIPSGMFSLDPEDDETHIPRAEAIFAGHLQDFELITNGVTGEQFHHLLVNTLGASIDVVAETGVLQGNPRSGGVAHGHFWLSGRACQPSQRARDVKKSRRFWKRRT